MIKNYFILFFIVCLMWAPEYAQENPERLLSCWTSKLKYEQFEVKLYLSSRNQTFKYIAPKAVFASDETDFNPRRPTFVLVHGYLEFADNPKMQKLAKLLLQLQRANVLIVDWAHGWKTTWNIPLYHQAAANVEFVGIRIKNFFKAVKKSWTKRGWSVNEWGYIHLIGFSLGAHVVGQAAKFLTEEENLLVDRITALDPAEPCFEDANAPIRLSKKHARFLDVIHTDGAQERNRAFGLYDAIGHADFYVNGGSIQPGCLSRRIDSQYTYEYAVKLFGHTINTRACYHLRALDIFIDSVQQIISKQCTYWAHPWNLRQNSNTDIRRILSRPCDDSSCPKMGLNAISYKYHSNDTNIFYVATSGSSPYCDLL